MEGSDRVSSAPGVLKNKANFKQKFDRMPSSIINQ